MRTITFETQRSLYWILKTEINAKQPFTAIQGHSFVVGGEVTTDYKVGFIYNDVKNFNAEVPENR